MSKRWTYVWSAAEVYLVKNNSTEKKHTRGERGQISLLAVSELLIAVFVILKQNNATFVWGLAERAAQNGTYPTAVLAKISSGSF